MLTPRTIPGSVLVVGATGYLGRVVVERLLEAGHHVTALVRTEERREGLPPGLAVRRGDLTDPASLSAAVRSHVGAVVHVGAALGEAVDLAAVQALTAPLRGTGRAFVYTSDTRVLGAGRGRPLDETSPLRPRPATRGRSRVERHVLDEAAEGVRAMVLRPGVVHGRGGGVPAILVRLAGAHGIGRHVGTRAVRWPMVHVDDLASLYVLALDRGDPGQVLHGVAEPGVDTRTLAEAAAVAAGVSGSRAWSVPEARAALGAPLAAPLAFDQVVLGSRSRAAVGWRPQQPGAAAEIATGSYPLLQDVGIVA